MTDFMKKIVNRLIQLIWWLYSLAEWYQILLSRKEVAIYMLQFIIYLLFCLPIVIQSSLHRGMNEFSSYFIKYTLHHTEEVFK